MLASELWKPFILYYEISKAKVYCLRIPFSLLFSFECSRAARLRMDPRWRPLQGNPHFEALLARYKLKP